MRLAGCALLAMLCTVVQGAEVYRSTDARGNVTYADRPQSDAAELVILTTDEPPTQTTAPQPARSRAAAAATATTPATPAAPVAQTAEERADARAKNCTAARERLASYTVSRRLFRTAESGEREYLNDDEVDEARARAAADVETWCD